MSDELKVAPTAPATAPQPPVAEAAKPPVSEAPAPDVFGGKSPAAVLAELQEKDALISAERDKALKAQHEAEFYRTLVEREKQGMTRPPEPTPPAPTVLPDEEWLQSPGRATVRTVQQELAQFRAELDRKEAERRETDARSAFEFGRSTAMKGNPKLYAGIEQDVAAAVVQSYNDRKVTATEMNQPQFWDTTAALLRFMRGERNLEKYYGSSPVPPAPASIETPSQAMPPQASANLTEMDRALISKSGFTVEQYLEKQKEYQKKGVI